MKRILIVGLTAILAVALIASAVWAQGPGPRFGRGDGMGLLRFADELKLTDQQKDSFEKLHTDFRIQMVDKRAELEKAEIELRSLKRTKAPEGEVLAKIEQVATLRGEMEKAHYRQHNQMRALLTEEQQEQFDKLRKEHREMRHNDGPGPDRPGRHMGPGGMGGRGPQGGHGF